MRDSEDVDGVAEDNRAEREFCISLSKSSLSEPSPDDSEPDNAPEWCATLRPIEGFSFNLHGMRWGDPAEKIMEPTFR